MTKCNVNRKALVEALDAIKKVIWNHGSKDVLKCVHLEVVNGKLEIWATDLEMSMKLFVSAEGELEPCLVNHTQLLARVKKGSTETCSISYDWKMGEKEKVEWIEAAAGGQERKVTVVPCKLDMEVHVNGGKVGHTLYAMDPDEYPPFGQPFEDRAEASVDAQELRQFIDINLKAVARETTRYAINGVLLRMKDDKRRMVSTDGRRLVITNFTSMTFGEETDVRVILPSKAVTIVKSMIDKKDRSRIGIEVGYTTKEPEKDADGNVKPGAVAVREPKQGCFTGDGWIIKSELIEGHFPHYADVIPTGADSIWKINKQDMSDLLDEVAVATTDYNPYVRCGFRPGHLDMYARAVEVGESEGRIPACFEGTGTDEIVIGFNPKFIGDILDTIDADAITVKLVDHERPGIFDGEQVRWVLMPCNVDGAFTKAKPDEENEGEPSTETEPVAVPA